MASAASPPLDDAEPPECPVCLSPFDTGAVAPRVLPCGHSLCGPCISSLPPASASASATAASLRCPLCSQVVPFSRSLGPSSLPKNLALLSLLPSGHSTSAPKPTPTSPPLPLPLHSAHSRLFSRFRHCILPHSASPLHVVASPDRGLAVGSLASDLGAPWFCARGHQVSLLPVEIPRWKPKEETAFYRPSYSSRVVASVNALSDAAKGELSALVVVSAREARMVCRVYGVWMGTDTLPLWLVSESHPGGVSVVLEERRGRDGVSEGGEEEVAWIGSVGMDVCKAVMGLHANGMVLGCLGLDCFCFDRFGHCLLDLNRALAVCRRVRGGVCSSKVGAFVAPEVVAVLGDVSGVKNPDFDGLVGCSSDVWSLGCVLAALVTGDDKLAAGWVDGSYGDWKEEVFAKLEASLVGTRLEPMAAITASCLSYDPQGRPKIVDVWRCIRGSLRKSCGDVLLPDYDLAAQRSFKCLLMGELSAMCSDSTDIESDGKMCISHGVDEISSTQVDGRNGGGIQNEEIDAASLDESQSGGVFKFVTLLSHRDCVTGLAIGGGFLFSSSYDKTINVWSLQDYSHVECLKGHEHKIMAIVVIDSDNQPLCISGDGGSGIFIWSVGPSLTQEPLIKWYEHSDWLYRGVHCLAVSGTGYLYSGGRDKSIKAWSLQDYSLCCTMTGHKSTVSCLAVANGILYSGSWDGTIRSWWLTDHSPLSVLEDDTLGSIAPVLSISTEANFVVSSYENGYLKIWKDDVLVKSEKLQNGAIYAVKMNGKWLYSGGWDKVINIQELSEDNSEVEIRDVASVCCDSIATSILYCDEKLIVGLSNREVKVYYKGS